MCCPIPDTLDPHPRREPSPTPEAPSQAAATRREIFAILFIFEGAPGAATKFALPRDMATGKNQKGVFEL